MGIKLGLVVGICGGVPIETDDEKEILLGDVIISTGVVQYDFGRALPNKFMRKNTLKDNLGRPNAEIRSFLAKMEGYRGRMRLRENTANYLGALSKMPGLEKASAPGLSPPGSNEKVMDHGHGAFSTR
jgi:hypothetical protein